MNYKFFFKVVFVLILLTMVTILLGMNKEDILISVSNGYIIASVVFVVGLSKNRIGKAQKINYNFLFKHLFLLICISLSIVGISKYVLNMDKGNTLILFSIWGLVISLLYLVILSKKMNIRKSVNTNKQT